MIAGILAWLNELSDVQQVVFYGGIGAIAGFTLRKVSDWLKKKKKEELEKQMEIEVEP